MLRLQCHIFSLFVQSVKKVYFHTDTKVSLNEHVCPLNYKTLACVAGGMVRWSKVLAEKRRSHVESGEETLSNPLALGARFSLATCAKTITSATRTKRNKRKLWLYLPNHFTFLR